MSYFSAITDVEMYHNPNEGRVIINENFRRMISGVTESVNSISGGTGSTTSTLSETLFIGNSTGNNNIIADTSSGDTISLLSNNTTSTNRVGISFVDGGVNLDAMFIGNTSLLKGGFFGIEQNNATVAHFDGTGVTGSRIIVDSSGITFRTEGASVLDLKVEADMNFKISSQLSGFYGKIVPTGLTEDRTHYLQDSNGTIAHVEDITSAISNLSPYVEYRANLTQSGLNAPSATTLGTTTLTGGSWSYSSTGSYLFTKTGAFSAASNVEVGIECAQVYAYTMSNAGFALISAAVYSDDAIEVRTSYWGVYPISGSTAQVVTPGAFGTAVSDAMFDDILSNTRFYVRVWS